MGLKEFKTVNGLANNETTQNIITTPITSNSAVTIDTVALSTFYSIEYSITIVQGTKVRTSKIAVQTDGTNVDYTEYGVVTTGGAISGVGIVASASGSNMILQITVTDAATTIARVRTIKNVLGIIQPYLPAAPTIGTITGATGTITIPFTPPADNGLSTITSYTATSNPAGYNATGTSSPLTATSIPMGTSFTYTVAATNSVGTGASSSTSNAVSLVDSSWTGVFTPSGGSQYAPSSSVTSSMASVDKVNGHYYYTTLGFNGGASALGKIAANPPSVSFVNHIASNNWYKYHGDILCDSSGNVYIAGLSYNGASTYNGYLTKFSSTGSVVAGMNFGTSFYPVGYGYVKKFAIDSTSVYLLGSASPGSSNGTTVMKIPLSLGSITWQKTLNGLGNGYTVTVDGSGNVYVIGGGSSPLIIKLNSSGELVWQKTYTSEGSLFSSKTDSSGNTYITTYQTSTYNPIITKIDTDGNVAWARIVNKGNSGQNWPRGLDVDSLGNVYIGFQDISTVAKLSSSGSLLYARSWTIPTGGLYMNPLVVSDNNNAFYVSAATNTSGQGRFAKFTGDGLGTGTYTYGNYNVVSTFSTTNLSYTTSNSTTVSSVTNSSFTYSAGSNAIYSASNMGSTTGFAYSTIS